MQMPVAPLYPAPSEAEDWVRIDMVQLSVAAGPANVNSVHSLACLPR